MKNLLLIFTLFAISFSVSAQHAVENVFRKYKNDKGVISMKFEGDVSSFFEADADIKSSIKGVNFLMFNDGKDISDKDMNKLSSKVESDKYELLIQARDKGNNVKIMGIENGESISKVFAQVRGEKMNIYFFLEGEIFLEDLAKLDTSNLGEMNF